MILRALLAAAVLVVPTGGSAAAGRAPALAVWPVRVTLAPGGTAVLHIANGRRVAAVVAPSVAGFTLDLHGTPRVVRSSAGTRLVALRPTRLLVRPGGRAIVMVRARRPVHTAPGDHPALVLLTARVGGGAGIGVRVRIGVTVEVRAPGLVRRRLEATRLVRRGRLLRLLVVNRGNVVEQVARGSVVARVLRHGRQIAVLTPRPRSLLPRSRGLLEFLVPRRLHGRYTIVVGARRVPMHTKGFPVSI